MLSFLSRGHSGENAGGRTHLQFLAVTLSAGGILTQFWQRPRSHGPLVPLGVPAALASPMISFLWLSQPGHHMLQDLVFNGAPTRPACPWAGPRMWFSYTQLESQRVASCLPTDYRPSPGWTDKSLCCPVAAILAFCPSLGTLHQPWGTTEFSYSL